MIKEIRKSFCIIIDSLDFFIFCLLSKASLGCSKDWCHAESFLLSQTDIVYLLYFQGVYARLMLFALSYLSSRFFES